MEEAKDVTEFLGPKITSNKVSKHISIDIFNEAANSFTYVLLDTCFTKDTEKITKAVALRLITICDSDNKQCRIPKIFYC